MKIALAHDFLIRWGGAEKVLFDLHKIFPKAPIYTLFYDKKFVNEYFPGVKIKHSYLQRRYLFLRVFTRVARHIYADIHRVLLPSMPPAVEALDFSDYDLVISSSSGFMKGIIVPSRTKHVCYLHTPTRWAWQDCKHGTFLRKLYIHFFRIWDFEASQRPDILMTNSHYTAQRIEKYYRRKAEVVCPGVEMNQESGIRNHELRYDMRRTSYLIPNNKYFIIISRLSVYKHIDWAIEAFKDLPYNLVIVGEGRELKRLKTQSIKIKKKIIFTGFIKNKNKLIQLVKNSIGLIHLAEEDFGLSILETLKLGKPVIAYDKGGSKELIKKGVSGEFFTNKKDLVKTIKKVAKNIDKYKSVIIKKSVNGFSQKKFKKEILKHITQNII